MMPLWVGDQVGFQHGLIPTWREHIRSLDIFLKKKASGFFKKTHEMINDWLESNEFLNNSESLKKMQACWKIPHHQLFVEKQTTQGEWLPGKAGAFGGPQKGIKDIETILQPCHDVR